MKRALFVLAALLLATLLCSADEPVAAYVWHPTNYIKLYLEQNTRGVLVRVLEVRGKPADQKFTLTNFTAQAAIVRFTTNGYRLQQSYTAAEMAEWRAAEERKRVSQEVQTERQRQLDRLERRLADYKADRGKFTLGQLAGTETRTQAQINREAKEDYDNFYRNWLAENPWAVTR